MFDEQVQVSSTMVQSVFGQLKANGYSDSQIVALSRELAALAALTLQRPTDPAVAVPFAPRWGLCFEVNLDQLGYV